MEREARACASLQTVDKVIDQLYIPYGCSPLHCKTKGFGPDLLLPIIGLDVIIKVLNPMFFINFGKFEMTNYGKSDYDTYSCRLVRFFE